ncbi:MAG: DUF3347 domain-containing protein [Sphingobacteriales bacterium]|nr:MAG: DUF3347 domain-containing protein [Sphingobacteriales bacterium]
MRHIPALLICAILGAASCNNTTEETKETTATEATEQSQEPSLPPQSKLDEANTQRLMNVVTRYYELKDALVATSPVRANSGANGLLKSATDFKQYLTIDSINGKMLLPYVDTVIDGSKAILADVKDSTTEKKRVIFESISNSMFALLKAAELKNTKIYRQYCPMAFNDKGAYWLANETEIRNPYFGKKMLECGEVTDTLK